MAQDIDTIRQRSVLLDDGSLGVDTETSPRLVQNHETGGIRVSLDQSWAQQLNIADQGSETLHSLSLGHRPVIIQHPAIIIQPAAVVNGESDELYHAPWRQL